MSHITTVRTTLNDLKSIQRALVYLGLEYKLNAPMRLWFSTPKADVVISTPSRFDIGLTKQADGTFAVQADSMVWQEVVRMKELRDYFPDLNITAKKRTEVPRDYSRLETRFGKLLTQIAAVTDLIAQADKRGAKVQTTPPDESGVIHCRITEVSA